MDFARNFELLGHHVVSPIERELVMNAHLWDLVTTRQEYPGTAHKDTRAIFLMWPLDARQSWDDVPGAWMPWCDVLPEATAMCKYIAKKYGRELRRALVAELKPGGHITPHVDEGEHAAATSRIHLVLRTEPGNVFKVNGECMTPDYGLMFSFNHRRIHEVWNHSESVRWHLIVDIK